VWHLSPNYYTKNAGLKTKRRDLSEDLRVDGRMRLHLKEISWEGVYWIHLAQDRDQWRAGVNMVMNLRVLYKARNFLTS